MKKKTKTYWRKKGSELAKKIARQKGYCEMCGKRGFMQGHHLLSEGAYPQMSGCVENIICVCSQCHLWGKVSFHGNPFDMIEKFNQKFPGRYEKLKKLAREREGIDYEKEYKALLKQDLKNLTIK